MSSLRARVVGPLLVILATILGTAGLAPAQDEPGEDPAASPDEPPADAPEPPPPVEPTEEDLRVEAELRRAFSRLEALQDVTVEVVAGVARLRGIVQRPTARETAATLASRFPSVIWIDNGISLPEAPPVEPPPDEEALQTVQDEAIQEQLASIFQQVEELRNVRVQVRSGVVRLTGEALSRESIGRAEELARDLEGVRFVDNDVTEVVHVGERLAPALEHGLERLRSWSAYLPLVGIGLVILIVVVLIAQVLSGWDWLFRKLTPNPLIRELLQGAVRLVIVLLGLILVLELLELTTVIGAVLGAAGLAGLALGLAFRGIVENYLSTLSLSVRRPFTQDDHVRIGDHEGKVIRLTTRDTVLMTLDGNHLRLPNSLVFGSVIVNYTRNPFRRFEFGVGIDPRSDIPAALEQARQTLQGMEGIVEEPQPITRVEELGDSTVQVLVQGWVDQREHDWSKVRSEAIRKVKVAFDLAGIEMPEPTYRVLTRSAEDREEETEAARPSAGSLEEEVALELDTSTDTVIDAQIEVDREASEEENLLDD